MTDIYRDEILSHYRNPHNFGDLSRPTATGRDANASCGDLLEFQLKVTGGMINDVRFKGIGCALSLAGASMLSDQIKGKPVSTVLKYSEKNMFDLVGIEVSSMRVKCITLPLRALQNALDKLER